MPARLADEDNTHLARAERTLDAPDATPAEREGAERALRALATAGFGPAQVKLSNRLWAGRGLPRDAAEAEQLLRLAATRGVPLAMLVLGQRLAHGMGLESNTPSAKDWLARAAATEFHPALEAWGAYLLDTGRAEEGRGLLERAAEAGNLAAMAAVGAYLMDDGQRERGEAILRQAAARGFARAHGLLGERLIANDPREAHQLLAFALQHREARFGLVLGLKHYLAGDYPAAVSAFEASLALGATGACLNLAYMARRGEWPKDVPSPDVPQLLAMHIKKGDAGALVNLALWQAGQTPPDWLAADASMAQAAPHASDLAWWTALRQKGDVEGHLVLGWLARHGAPGDLAPATHLAVARAAGWMLPAWLAHPADSHPAGDTD